MARMFNRSECAQWIREACYAGWDNLPADRCISIKATAIEQARNLHSIEQTRLYTGCVPTWCDIGEYSECVDMLWEAARLPRCAICGSRITSAELCAPCGRDHHACKDAKTGGEWLPQDVR